MIDNLTSLVFSMYENKGVYALLLGSGVSRSAQIPTGWEITLDLIRRLALLNGIIEHSDWAAWYKEKYNIAPNYSDLLDKLSSTPDERRSIIHSYIEPTPEDFEEGRKVPTKAHRAIARLVKIGIIRVIITTNFDRLIETALTEEGIVPTVIKSEDDLNGAVPLIHSNCYILKIHGDYLDTRIKNTETELQSYSEKIDSLLDRIIDEQGLIICGWSGDWDQALRNVIVRSPNRRYPLYWATRSPLSPLASDVCSNRCGKIIHITDADSFFERIAELITVQSEFGKNDPISTELLVSLTKKYLSSPEFRISLYDLLGSEAKRLVARLQEEEFSVSGEYSVERFISMVKKYEISCEPLIRQLGIIGMWGDQDETRTIAEYIQQIDNHGTSNGLTIYIELHCLPAILLFYAYGIGLLKSQKYQDLYLFLSTARIGHNPTANIFSFLINPFSFIDNHAWQQLPGLSRKKTAFSDHLHDIFGNFTKDYMYIDKEFTLYFEELELLSSLVCVEKQLTKETLKEVTPLSHQISDNYWVPIGRSAWDTDNRNKIFEKWLTQPVSAKILGSGFTNGDPENLQLAIGAIKHFAARYNRYG